MQWLRTSGLLLGCFLLAGLAYGNEDQPLKSSDKDRNKAADKGQTPGKVDAFLKRYDKTDSGFIFKADLPHFAQKQFDELDDNKDGKLSRDELQKHSDKVQCWAEISERRQARLLMVGTLIGRVAASDQPGREVMQGIYDVFQQVDRDGDGKIDRSEWEATRQNLAEFRANAMLDRQGVGPNGKVSKDQARGHLLRHFDEFDLNRDGVVDRDELLRIFGGKATPAKNDASKVSDKEEKKKQ